MNIDPPYNTGNDFVYKDNFVDNISNYKSITNQNQRTNPETSGRYHTDWLNMMYSRLYLARSLLTEDGVIFISIDDNEFSNLRKIMDEIFGENNFIATIVWERAFSPVNLKQHFSESHDYIVAYAKNLMKASCNGLKRSDQTNERYQNPDGDKRGVWTSADMTVGPVVEEKLYEIVTPGGNVVKPASGRCWLFTKERYLEMLNDNRIWFGTNGNNMPRVKKFLSEVKMGVTPMTIWKHSEVGHSQQAQQKLKQLFNNKAYFDYPKSVELIKRLLDLYSQSDSVVLDFFSGSATTAHATVQINAEDEGNRKFIMVQLPELTEGNSEAYKDGYKNICEIGKERIRRAGDMIVNELNSKQNAKTLLDEENFDPEKLDIGFKVFKLESSNFTPFEGTREGIQATLEFETKNIERTDYEILYEIMLKYGVFDKPITEISIENKKVFSVGSGYLIVCLDKSVTETLILEIAKLKPKTVIFDETGFLDDNAKDNAVYTLQKAGVEEVKSI